MRRENSDPVDRLIVGLDRALRTIAGVHEARRPSPAERTATGELSPAERRESAALMRVNHAGEVCAQALYEGQALAAREGRTRAALEQAAREEEDHLAWCAQRIRELGGRMSLLNPLWYAGSLAIGFGAGALGDRWSLAFLAETERQVEAHLQGHLAQLAEADERTRAVVRAMQAEEAAHRQTALSLGAAELPAAVKAGMRLLSRIMTTVAYRL
jgi:ubiquinone biosynthesis monooxygenase Coq7